MNTQTQLDSDFLFIKRIHVDKLFGLYTYDLAVPDSLFSDISRLLILYGDNGSGKTTVLKLLFHILSPSIAAGHRSYIAKTPFRYFSVELNNNIVLSVSKTDTNFVGPYTLSLFYNDDCIKVDVPVDQDSNVPPSGDAIDKLIALYKIVESFDVRIYLLSDLRQLDSDKYREHEQDSDRLTSYVHEYASSQIVNSELAIIARNQILHTSITRLNQWARRRALGATSESEENAYSIYSNIVSRISKSSVATPTRGNNNLEELIRRIQKLLKRAEDYVKYGLVSIGSLDSMIGNLSNVPPAQSEIVSNVLEPFVDSFRARLDSLDNLQRLLSSFVQIMNRSYARKNVRFNITRGLEIVYDNDVLLDPEVLSSGEKHILLLICNLLITTDSNSIFFLDEPEISLNVKWQRELLSSIMQIT